MVHEPGVDGVPAGTLPPFRLTVRGGEIVTLPPQVLEADPGTTVSTFPGRVSDSWTPV